MTTHIRNTQAAEEAGACRFCVVDPCLTDLPAWNRPLLVSANFYVVPSLGSLTEGWLLVVPKQHVVAAAALHGQLAAELWTVTAVVRDVLRKQYGPVWLFEHGPSAANRPVGCGVDHAHLHLVPVRGDLLSAAAQFLPHGIDFERSTFASCQRSWQNGEDYLYVEAPDGGTSFAAFGTELGSQVFRKAIAHLLGCPERFNWRSDPGVGNIDLTIQQLGEQLRAFQDEAAFCTTSSL
jgi:ATP adenylyltransferase